MAASSPGIVLTASQGAQPADVSRLAPGDVVYFDADAGDGTEIDHVGMYVGLDSDNKHRFISSRKTADGPTMGDINGKSILDGTGLYARTFRLAQQF